MQSFEEFLGGFLKSFDEGVREGLRRPITRSDMELLKRDIRHPGSVALDEVLHWLHENHHDIFLELLKSCRPSKKP